MEIRESSIVISSANTLLDRFDAGGKAPGGKVEIIQDLFMKGFWIEF